MQPTAIACSARPMLAKDRPERLAGRQQLGLGRPAPSPGLAPSAQVVRAPPDGVGLASEAGTPSWAIVGWISFPGSVGPDPC